MNLFSLGIYEDINLKPTCVQFLPDNEHNVLIGNQGGQVGLYDIRKPKECIAKDSTGNYWIYFNIFSKEFDFCIDMNCFAYAFDTF